MENIITPPDTVAVRKALLHHRRALADIRGTTNQQQDFSTPDSKSISRRQKPEQKQERIKESLNNVEKRLINLIYYKNPGVSFLTLVAGTVLLSSVRYLFLGDHGVSCFAFICYLILSRIVFNTGRIIFTSPGKPSKLLGSKAVQDMLQASERSILLLASLHDSYISIEDPSKTLYIGGGAWILSMIANYLSIWSIISFSFFGIFTIPYAIESHKDSIAPLYMEIKSAIKARWKLLGLNRRQKNSLAIVALLSFWFYTSWINRLFGSFVALLAVRCTLKPEEIDSIKMQTAPLTRSVKKSARRFSVAATDFVRSANGKMQKNLYMS